MGTKNGVQAEWILMYLNFIVDDISRLKTESEDGEFDSEDLKITYPILESCRQFQPLDTLLGVIWDILLHKSCTDHLTVRKLKPSALGQFTS